MNLQRGDIVYVAVKGPYTTQPRPVVVVQATVTLQLMESVTVCPVTSVEVEASFVRVAVAEGRRRVLTEVCRAELALMPGKIYAIVAEQSLPKLLAAALVPGIVLAVLY
jgi:hypothetical protein